MKEAPQSASILGAYGLHDDDKRYHHSTSSSHAQEEPYDGEGHVVRREGYSETEDYQCCYRDQEGDFAAVSVVKNKVYVI